MPAAVVVFDAYGTLFDVTAAARAAAADPGHAGLATIWPRLAADWRRKQLEYSWLRTIMGLHADFAQVTAEALDWALAAQGLADPALRARLIALHDRLDTYPEVAATLAALARAGVPAAILSNGSPAMLAAAVDHAGVGGHLAAVISVEEAGMFKPAPQVYALVGARFDTPPDRVLFVSSNGWDVAGATAHGFRTVWVNRAGDPRDRLPHGPAHVTSDLTPIPEIALS